ncbi:MAG: DUF2312 domain-containing protein [Rhizobiales bacterium]|nr:DUF2312 domain-containing protein [Hyphomicrobiales bacterium]
MSNVAQIEDYQEDDNSSGLAKERLKSFVERVERLEEEKQTIMDDMKEILAEAKGEGFDVKVIKEIIKIRKQDANDRAEFLAILDLYMAALGME